MTVNDLITLVLVTAQVFSPGDTIDPDSSALVFNQLNLIIASWNASIKKALAANFDPSVYTFVAVTQFAAVGDTITLPNGWIRALLYTCVEDIAGPFSKPLDSLSTVPQKALEARQAILTSIGTPAND